MLRKAMKAKESLHNLFKEDNELINEEKKVLDTHQETMDLLMNITSDIKRTNRFLHMFDKK